MKKINVIEITVPFKVKLETLEGLLDSASRGASYWATTELAYESEVKKILYKEWDSSIVDNEDVDYETTYVLNLKKIIKGLRKMAAKDPTALGQVFDGVYDDNTGDTFLQYCIFGEVIYG
jgi:hypothetical protein